MEIYNHHPDRLQRVQEVLREDVHPAGEDDQVGLAPQDLLSQRRVVALPRILPLGGVLLAGGLETARDQVEVLGRDGRVGLLGTLARESVFLVVEQTHNARIGYPSRRHRVHQSLKVAAVTRRENHDAARLTRLGHVAFGNPVVCRDDAGRISTQAPDCELNPLFRGVLL